MRGINLKRYPRLIQQVSCLMIVFCIGFSTTLSYMGKAVIIDKNTEQSTNDTLKLSTNNDDYNWFNFAIIWGEFEILSFKSLLGGLRVYNPYPYNNTMHVIGWVSYEDRFVYRNASNVYCPWWIGFVGSHRLFVIGWGNSVIVD